MEEVSVLERSATGWVTILQAQRWLGQQRGRAGTDQAAESVFSNVPNSTKTLSALCGSPEAIG